MFITFLQLNKQKYGINILQVLLNLTYGNLLIIINRLNTDCSYDFDGSLSGITKTTKSKPSYHNQNGLYEVTASLVSAYNYTQFKSKLRVKLSKGSTVYAAPSKHGNVYRLKTGIGYFTANKKYMKLIKKIK